MKPIKNSLIVAGVENYTINSKINKTHIPQQGDVAVFEVLHIGKHKSLQSDQGYNHYIFPGDKILATFGNRYATNQFEGYVPTAYQETYEILGQGGIVGALKSMHTNFDDIGTTNVKLIGYACNKNGNVINTIYHNIDKVKFNDKVPPKYPVYLSIGSSMDSGKTTTAAFFCRGLMLSGKKVAYIKLTGTAHKKDCRIASSGGAEIALDFSDCGYPATFLCSTEEILTIYATLLHQLETLQPNIDALVVEIADGLLQEETYQLLQDQHFMQNINGVLLSCYDSLGLKGSLDILKTLDIEPILLGGWFTASPLLVQEAKKVSSIPIFTLDDFVEQDKLLNLLGKPLK